MNRLLMTMMALAAAFAASLASAATLEDVDNSFFPYKNWKPEFPGLQPGTVVNQSNIEQFKDVVDFMLYDHIKQGWYEIKVSETTSFDLHPNYVQATRDHLNETTLGEQVGG